MPDSKELRLITFRLGTETFVLDIMAVRQIIPYNGSTPVPRAPEFVEGIIVLRDQVIPVIDLRSRLFPSSRTAPGKSLVLITDGAAGVMGLKVDAVRQIITVAMDDLLPPPPLVGGIRGELLIAVISRAGEIYLLIDIENLLSGEEKLELESARLESPAD